MTGSSDFPYKKLMKKAKTEKKVQVPKYGTYPLALRISVTQEHTRHCMCVCMCMLGAEGGGRHC